MLFILISCKQQKSTSPLILNDDFYTEWYLQTEKQALICCTIDSIHQYVSPFSRKMTRYRDTVFDTLYQSIENKQIDSLFIDEYYVEAMEFGKYRMTISYNGVERKARSNRYGINIYEEKLMNRKNDFKEIVDCCLDDYYWYLRGNVHVQCQTLITINKDRPMFDISLIFDH